MSESSPCSDTKHEAKDRRVSDEIRLRELEISTQYELKYLSDSFTDMKEFVKTALQRESDKFETLNKKVNWLGWIILAQMAGLDIDLLIKMVSKTGIM